MVLRLLMMKECRVVKVGRKLKQPMSGMRFFRESSALSCTNIYTGES